MLPHFSNSRDSSSRGIEPFDLHSKSGDDNIHVKPDKETGLDNLPPGDKLFSVSKPEDRYQNLILTDKDPIDSNSKSGFKNMSLIKEFSFDSHNETVSYNGQPNDG